MVRIAIDINDVIRDYTRQFDKYYKKGIDPLYEVDYDEINDPDLFLSYPFVDDEGNPDREAYNQFKYTDYAFEIFGRADVMDRQLQTDLNIWLQNTLRNFDEGKNPSVMLVSPFEIGLSIQSTLSFLSRIGTRVREIYFPIDSQTIWDKCDILITADPRLIEKKPEDKVAVKIEAPYNKETEADYTFESLMDVIHDSEHKLINLIEEKNGNVGI